MTDRQYLIKTVFGDLDELVPGILTTGKLKPHNGLPEHQERRLLRFYARGELSVPQIAEIFGINTRSVARIAKRNGLRMRVGGTVGR